jgi:hypothetical protein
VLISGDFVGIRKRRERDPALAVTTIHDIVCNSSAWRRFDGNVANAQPRFKLTVTRNARAAGLRAVYS